MNRVIREHQALPETVYGVVVPDRGATRWVLVSASPDYGPDGALQQIVINFHDISALRQSQETLRVREHTYRSLFETVPQGVVYQNRDGVITAANAAAQRILALTLEQLQGLSSFDPAWRAVREDGTDFPGEAHPSMVALRTGHPVRGVVMGVMPPNRGLVWISVSATPLLDRGTLTGVYAIFEDITEKRHLEAQIRHLAFHDPLTHLPNRHLLEDRIRQALIACRRDQQLAALIVLDLDNFKPLNDVHGHLAGDLLLVEVAARLRQAVRAIDTVARFGGDEFVVVLHALAGNPASARQQALAVAHKIHQSLGAPYDLVPTWGGPSAPIRHHCGASIGVALVDPVRDEAASALRRADQAMYAAKARGRNRVHLHAEPPPAS